MSKYEMIVVVSAKLEDEDRTAALEKVQNYITRFGGTVESVDDWGKKKLAYEIQKMREAYYSIINFEAPADCPAQVENRVRLMESVLRFLCVKKEVQ
ncbi:MAG: 30S ribosomal protein S6 [Lachnospiraceae bacterium]|nr:30S ribosomal protein S6 [Lachnospiraceae bacterium]